MKVLNPVPKQYAVKIIICDSFKKKKIKFDEKMLKTEFLKIISANAFISKNIVLMNY